LRLFIDQIKDAGLKLEGDEQVGELSRHFARITGEEVFFAQPLHYSLRAHKVADIVEIEGRMSTELQFSCSRCLADFMQPIEIDFSVAFARQDKFNPDAAEDDEFELNADELGLSVYHGDEIDLQETLYEQIVLSLPPQPLCDTDCKGLCAHCGANLNEGSCGCTPEPFNSKFAALKDFKSPK